MQRLHDGAMRLVEATTDVPSPFAANLLLGYVAEFMYQGDAPQAERRASVLSLDSGLLSELLEQGELGELLDPQVVAQVGEGLQHTAPERRVKGVEGLADVLRELGPLSHAEIAARLVHEKADEVDVALTQLAAARRIIPVTLGAKPRWASVEDAARLRDGLGVALPPGVPAAFLQAVDAPVRDLLSRYARTHGPFTSAQAAAHFGLGVAIVNEQLVQLRDRGRLLPCNVAGAGEGDTGSRREWVWDEVFRRLRARSLQAARAAFGRLMLERQGVVTDAAPAPAGRASNASVSASLHLALLDVLADGGAYFVRQLTPLLRRMEDAGRILRGRFVNGMGAAQFAEQDSIERLRELAAPASTPSGGGGAIGLRSGQSVRLAALLASASLRHPAVAPRGAMVVICGGKLALYLAPSGRQLLTFLAFDEANIAGWLAASLRALTTGLRREKGRGFTLETVDGRPVGAGPWGEALSNAGFSRVPKGYAWYG
ncbi:DNA glycosylase AlkZ-like family protein [Candidatus Sodalis pierantonius]|uniref:DNA glycosylase AlkZ-like family protein n=1 Tax=Candidatus Sodalis pierantonii TaxID=1486991 RepID=UPI00046D4C0C|nr:crosslink repair DNA glycosylase YcaQ family protein [Candidatus Sodalis pierantonius]